jgi:predicted small secreted protein
MKSSLKHILILLFASAIIACTGCQTTKGFGRDVEHLGDAIQDP